MKSRIHKSICAMIGLGLLLIFTGDTAYGQCGTPGNKPCAKSYKRKAKKRVVRGKKVVHAAKKKAYAPPRRVERYTILGSTDTVSAPGYTAPADDQTPPRNTYSIPKQISGGVLNGKAITLPRPAYPPAARAVRASGAVNVQVLIDEEGNVVSASAVSGHALLRSASVQAARGAKFSPTKLAGQPVKVSGIITYNFVP